MDRFKPKTDKRARLTEVVSFHGRVPLERGLCYVIYLVSKHDRRFEDPSLVLSAARDTRLIREHNQQYGTNLHGQQWLIDAHARDPEHYAPANPVDQTSHCLRADGDAVYVNRIGQWVPAGAQIAWFQRGIDWFSNGVAQQFVDVARGVGVDVALPYKKGSELHHTVVRHSPTRALIAHNVINAR